MREEIPIRLTNLVSQYFPGWTVVDFIGRGSYSKVYRLQQADQNAVYDSALKWIEYAPDPSDIERIRFRGGSDREIEEHLRLAKNQLQREIELMDRLSGNSHIVNMLAHQIVDREDGGFDLLIRMEYLTPLPQLIGEMTVQDAVQMGIDICRGLIDCEKENIVHRDIKPANIFRNRHGSYKLGDFGVARQNGAWKDTSPQGTPLYMAPEVYKGQSYEGKKADIYSLGLVLYELFNAQCPPFTPLYSDPTTSEQEEESVSIRMSGRDLPYPEQAPQELAAIILQACCFDLEDRYESAQEMLDALNALDLKERGEEKLQQRSSLPPSPVQEGMSSARNQQQNKQKTEKSTPGDTNPLSFQSEQETEAADGGTDQPICDEEGDANEFSSGNGAFVQDVIDQKKKEEDEKRKKRQKKTLISVLLAVAVLILAGILFIMVFTGRVSDIRFDQNGIYGAVSWKNGGIGPWRVSVLRDDAILFETQVRERQATFELAPGYDYTIRVEGQSINATMQELPGYTGDDLAIRPVRLQFYRVQKGGGVGPLSDTKLITYSPLLGTEGERGYRLTMGYDKASGEDVQAVCFLFAEGFQATLTDSLKTSAWIQFAYFSLNDALLACDPSVTEITYKIYANECLLTMGICSVER